ncbi:hypothetical protein PV416_32525 [Streptomyces ipomoeae]|nr:hypothetical protein [Streptomyces ipomoeae]MDX2825671.1 hypothetical protein [Streptomyces ipomoeae]MDX2878290.1 hypothetical protein [Streptomyces ipomoeae]
MRDAHTAAAGSEKGLVPASARTSSYNVRSGGDMRMGTFDSHSGLPFANVRTDITVNDNGRHGGDANAGPLFGARFTHRTGIRRCTPT